MVSYVLCLSNCLYIGLISMQGYCWSGRYDVERWRHEI